MFSLMFTTLLVLLSLGVVGILHSSTRVSEFLQFLVICAVVALGIHSIRRYRGNGPFGSKAKE
jgi:cytochrome c biogenesis protein CcdA